MMEDRVSMKARWESADLVEAEDFPEIPDVLVTQHEWVDLLAKPVCRQEPIHILEGRVTLSNLEDICAHADRHHMRHLCLGDNLSSILSLSKGRASDFGLLSLCRRVCALSLACSVKYRVRWVRSEVNPSDELSRRFLSVSQPESPAPRHVLRLWWSGRDGRGGCAPHARGGAERSQEDCLEAEARRDRLQGCAGVSSRLLEGARTRGPRTLAARSSTEDTAATKTRLQAELPGTPRTPRASFWTGTGHPADPATPRHMRALVRRVSSFSRVPASVGALDTGLTFLEEQAVTKQTSEKYVKAMKGFLKFLDARTEVAGVRPLTAADLRQLAIKQTQVLDRSLCDYFEELYFAGGLAHKADQMKGDLGHFLAEGGMRRLPRSQRALGGFHHLVPGKSRFPLPWQIFYGLLADM